MLRFDVKRLLAFTLLGTSAAAGAAPVLNPVFSNHAVLQRGRPLAVWGTADPREQVTVTLGGARRTVRAGLDGVWRVELPAMQAGGPYQLTASGAGGASASAHDLLVGDVWLCSGQSNMEFPVSRALNGDAETASASDPFVRILSIPQRTSVTPETRLPDDTNWQLLTPGTARDFSAACWFMVRELKQRENVPIGMIDASWGGTRIRPWMDEAAARAAGGAEDAELLALFRRDPAAAGRRFGEVWGRWWRGVSVRIADDGRPATRVRYAWSEGAVVNLYDEAGLPAGPFELSIR